MEFIIDYINDNVRGMLETLLDREPTDEEIEETIKNIDIEDICEYIDSKIQSAI